MTRRPASGGLVLSAANIVSLTVGLFGAIATVASSFMMYQRSDTKELEQKLEVNRAVMADMRGDIRVLTLRVERLEERAGK